MSKVPCGGFELDESLALNDGKLGLAPGAGGSQADWNVTDSADPAFIKNKPFGVKKGAVVRSVNGLSFVENTGYRKEQYPYKVDVTSVFKPFDIDAISDSVQLIVDGIIYSDIIVDVDSNGMVFEKFLYSENCPVAVDSNYGISASDQVIIYSKTPDVVSVDVIDLGKESIQKIDAQYLPDQVQSNWNENDSSSPAYILNKPKSLGGGVTWFSASGDDGNLVVRKGKDWDNGSAVTGTELVNAFENGVCRFKVTIVSCCGTYPSGNGTMVGYNANDSHMRAYISTGSRTGINSTSVDSFGTEFIVL